ncbi:TRC40/GET3/ArsA family transport-energizing ATPase [Epidermidibacterium keratini]|uniref:TRC40/GET3/ArsA family transport-energizing ATPase n=1 Tax=Epidermidibacterium keratini TaxID=1891644 RepID=A0A7L4YK07_9ACTN|nr:ArsA family ATPase [Epidermidibacterium keratini]QHB99183.1 TRC40/GET3/ArsA family transport-energizing ATPase [Epidermidibacterium keratini]
MRIVLFTGKGGVGKTTTSAATAVRAAARGDRVLLMSADPAHSLAEALASPLTNEPARIAERLDVVQVDPQARFEGAWAQVAGYLRDLVRRSGTDPLTAEEITVVPGAEELMVLLALDDYAGSDRWDAIVVDCAPTADTLRLLSLPDIVRWYAERMFPKHTRLFRAIRGNGELPIPSTDVRSGMSALAARLERVAALLADQGQTSVRLVTTPEHASVAEARRTFTSLELYGYAVDEVVVNRLVPSDGDDPWRLAWARSQREQLEAVRGSFTEQTVRSAAYRSSEPTGVEALGELGEELYGDDDALAPAAAHPAWEVDRSPADVPGGEEFHLLLRTAFAERGDIELARSADDLVVTVGGRRRYVSLPSALRRCTVSGATFEDRRLRISFSPDPRLWPR